MAHDPLQRHATALEMGNALRRWIDRHNAAEPLVLESSRPRSRAPGERRKRRARPTLRTWLGVSVLVALVGAGMTLALWPPVRDHEREPERRGGQPAAPAPFPVAP